MMNGFNCYSYHNNTIIPTLSARAFLNAIGPNLDHDLVSNEPVLLGKGFFAKVYKIKYLNAEMALKIPRSTECISKFMKEIVFLKSLSHNNILRFYGTGFINGSFGYVTEFLNYGPLTKLITTQKQSLKWTLIVKIAQDISKGLKYLHGKGLLHRDLSSENILLEILDESDEEYRAVVADFGLSIHLNSSQAKQVSCVGNPYYTPPEHLNRTHLYSYSSDMFSYGLILCELITGYKNEHPDIPRTNNFGVNYELLPIRRDCPKWLQNLACDCCKVHIKQRPSADVACSIISNNQRYVSLWNTPKSKFPVNNDDDDSDSDTSDFSKTSTSQFNASINGPLMPVSQPRANRSMSVITNPVINTHNSLLQAGTDVSVEENEDSVFNTSVNNNGNYSSALYSIEESIVDTNRRDTDQNIINANRTPRLVRKKSGLTFHSSTSPLLRRYNSLDNFLEPTNFGIVKAREDPHYSNLPLSPQTANRLAKGRLSLFSGGSDPSFQIERVISENSQ